MSLNKAQLIGNLGQDPELRSTPSGESVCEFSVATNEKWKGKDGQMQERVEWHKVTVWGKNADNCAKYLHKGSKAYIEGRIRTRSWEDKEGTTRYTTEIVAQKVDFLDPKSGGKPDRHSDPGPIDPGDDIPF